MRAHTTTRIVCLGVLLYGAFPVQQDVVEDKSATQKACDLYTMYSQIFVNVNLFGEANYNEYPWMVALGYRDVKNNTSFRCSGTIISEYFILTAANCATVSNEPAFVRIGTLILKNNGVDYQIDTIIRHEDYDTLKILHDIALIRVSAKIFFTPFARPACLYTELEDVDENVTFIIGGWGVTSKEGKKYEYENMNLPLVVAGIATVPLSDCNRTVLELNKLSRDSSFMNGLSPSHYCAADPDTYSNNKKDACDGDEGGALQFYTNGVCKVVGIISKVSCASAWPGIYTRVAYYLDWIESKVWPNGFNSTSFHIDFNVKLY